MAEHFRNQDSFDFIIIGAGITGINAAYRITQQFPGKTYGILDRRGWAEHGLSSSFLASVEYVDATAKEHGIDKHIRFNHDVLGINWSSKRQTWDLDVDVKGKKQTLQAKFVIGGTGYFDYKSPRVANIPGLENFKGTIAHPQFWPKDLDYADKNVVIIGSGATAVTMMPVIAQKAATTTMLQRSPTYIMSMAMQSSLDDWIRRWVPETLGHRIITWRFTLLAWLMFYFSQVFPNTARKVLEKATTKELPKGMKYEPNFKPSYAVWDQRLYACPDGDFFRAMDDGKATVVTAEIEMVEEGGILLTSGERIQADIIVTATGLQLQMLGGATLTLDGTRQIHVGEQYMWRGTMLQDVPNLTIVIGYWNTSWTLGSDLAVRIFLKNVREMERQHATSFTPVLEPGEGKKMKPMPLWKMTSTYLQNSVLPKASLTAPWTVKDNYLRDLFVMMFGDLRKGLKFGTAG